MSYKPKPCFGGESEGDVDSDDDEIYTNPAGKVVNKARSQATSKSSIKRFELDRNIPECFKEQMLRGENGALMSQVFVSFGEEEMFPKVEVKDIWVKQQTVNYPSDRDPDKKITRLRQVRPGTPGAKPLSCLQMTDLESLVDILTTKPDGESKALFHFNQKKKNGKGTRSKASQLIHRLQHDSKFQMVWSMETDASGSNKGWHNLLKEKYSEDMVWLFGHRWLDVEDPDKVAMIKKGTKNRAWSFKDLPRR